VTEQQGVGGRVEGVVESATLPRNDSGFLAIQSRLQELEAENARLRSLVGELLVANQLLREHREHASPSTEVSR